MRRKHSKIHVVGALFGSVIASAAFAGDLNPPPGLIEPTMKTLDQVEPRIPLTQATAPGSASGMFIIDEAGSYYLTEDLQGQNGVPGIRIQASGVTVDLNGFTLRGANGVDTASGIVVGVLPAPQDLTIRNGRVQGWTGDGISINQFSRGARIENVTVSNCDGNGFVTPQGSTLINCVARNNDSDGFNVLGESVLRGCTSVENDGHGFVGGSSVTIEDCVASENLLDGIKLGNSAVVRGCATSQNQNGILVLGGSTVHGCSSDTDGLISGGGGASGINVGPGSVVTACSVRNVGGFEGGATESAAADPPSFVMARSFEAGVARDGQPRWQPQFLGEIFTVGIFAEQSVVDGCSVDGANSTGFAVKGGTVLNSIARNSATGFRTLEGGTFKNCTATGNGTGFVFSGTSDGDWATVGESCSASENGTGFVADRALVLNCNATGNLLNGFVLFEFCTLRDGAARLNDGDGVEVVGEDNVVDGMSIAFNGTGFGISIESSSGFNLVVRNDLSFNSISDMGGNTSQIGPIDDLTSPWSNFQD